MAECRDDSDDISVVIITESSCAVECVSAIQLIQTVQKFELLNATIVTIF
jgi:hypothetical protein